MLGCGLKQTAARFKFLRSNCLPVFSLRLVQRHSRSQETDFDIFTVVVPSGGAWGGVVVKALRNWRTVPGSIPGGVTGDFFRGTPDRTMCPEVDSASESEYQGFLLG